MGGTVDETNQAENDSGITASVKTMTWVMRLLLKRERGFTTFNRGAGLRRASGVQPGGPGNIRIPDQQGLKQ